MKRHVFIYWSAALCWSLAACTGRALIPFPAVPGTPTIAPTPTSVKPQISDDLATKGQFGLAQREFPGSADLSFENLSIQDGLSSDLIYTLYQDHFGYLWIGTADGLNRYDGYSYKVFRYDSSDPDSLSNNTVYTVYEDRQGAIWVGTNGGGLNRFERQTERFIRYQHDPDDPDSLSNDIVYQVYEDRDGNLWIATFGGGLDRFDQLNGKFVHFHNDPADPDSLSNDHVPFIYEDHSGTLWIATFGGLNRFDRRTETFTRYRHDPENPNSLSSDRITSIVEDRWGELWVGTLQGGLNWLDRASGRFARYQHNPADPFSLSHNDVFFLLEDSRGLLWVGTMGGGMNLYDREHDRFIRYQHDPADQSSLSNNFIYSMYEDRAGIIWIATASKLSRYDPERAKFQRDPVLSERARALGRQEVSILFEDSSGALWIGSQDGLWRVDSKTGEVRQYLHDSRDPDSLAEGPVNAIYEDREGVLWIGSGSSGIDRFDPSRDKFIHYRRSLLDPLRFQEDNITSIFEDESGNLWFGTDSGLSHYNRQNNEFIHYFISADSTDRASKDRISAILEDQAGLLWLGTSGYGLVRFDREKKAFIHLPPDPDGLNNGGINTLFEDSRGRLWIGSQERGLIQFDRQTGEFLPLGVKEALPGNSVTWIMEDRGGYLWVSTEAGLSRFDPERELFENFDVTGSPARNQYDRTGCYRNNGDMLIGGVGGILAFHPEGLWLNPHRPPIVLTAFRSGGKTLNPVDDTGSLRTMTLSWPNQDFEFEFAALNFTHPEKNQYAYRLEGYDEGWNYAGQRRFGQYTSLPGGNYLLRLKGSNNEGVWNEEGIAIPITIVPAFWETWAFRIGLAGLLVAGIVVGYRWRVRSMEAYRRTLEGHLAEQTEALAALNEITATISQSPDLHATLAEALEKTLQIAKIESGGIYLLDEKSSLLNIATYSGLGEDFIHMIDGLSVGEGFSGRVVQTGQPLVVNDLASDSRLTRSAVVEAGLRSVAIVPLISKGKTLGTLFAITRGYREFDPQEIDLLASIGQQIGVALENAQLYDETRRKLAQLLALQETNQAVVSTLDLDQLLNLIIRHATTLLQADGGILNLVDWDNLEDEVYACTGSTSNVLGVRCRLDSSFSGWVTLHNQAAISNRVQDDPRIDRRVKNGLLLNPLHNTAIAPLSIKDRVIGTLVVIDKLGGAGEFDQDDLDLLVAFANQAAAAIENARLYIDVQHRAEQFRVIAEVGRRLALILDVDEVFRQVVRLIQESFGYYHVGIGLVEEDEVVYRFGAGKLWDDPDFQYRPARLKIGEEGISGWVAAIGKPLVVPDVEKDRRYVCLQGSAARSELTVPIIVKGQVIGVLDAQSDRLKAFDETDLLVMQSLAHQAAVAVENIRYYKRAQQLAVSEERSRLARDLHDAVTQTLFSASLLAEALPATWEQDHQGGRRLLQELRGLSRGALAEMRTLLLELRPAALVETRLEDLLRQLGEAASGREGLTVNVLVEGSRPDRGQAELPADVHIAFYRIAQEAFNNIVKHARASQVTVRFCFSCTEASRPGEQPGMSALLSIRDDGRGFDPTFTAADRLGLGIMHERAQAISASLTIDSHPGEGTQVTLLWEPNETRQV